MTNSVINKIDNYKVARRKLIKLLKTNFCTKDFLRSNGITDWVFQGFIKGCKTSKLDYNIKIKKQYRDKRIHLYKILEA